MAYIPERGDLIWLSFDPQTAGHRPVLVISPLAYNDRTGLCLACPIMSQVKRYPFEFELPSGLPIAGVVLADQIKSLDWRARRAEFGCSLPTQITEGVIAKISTLLE